MKLFKPFALAIIIMSFFDLSCKKDVDAPSSADFSIEGFYTGSYTAASVGGNYFYSFAVSPDHTLYEQGKGADGKTYYAIGTWSLSGTSFSCTLTSMSGSQAGVVQTETAKFDKKTGKLTEGVWVDSFDSGTFELTQIK